ncbi:MAG: hypothetical protein RIR26_795 [Pseudomonadota bacterium]
MNLTSAVPLHSRKPSPVRALLLMVAAHFCFSLMIFFIKAAQKVQFSLHPDAAVARFGTWESVFFRCLPMTLMCLFVMARRKRGGHAHPPLGSEEIRWLVTRGLVGAISMACFFHGTLTIPLALSSLFSNASVFLIGLLGHVFLAERMTGSRVVFALFGLAGVALVLGTGLFPETLAHNSQSSAPTDYLIAFAAGVLSAIAYFSVRKMKSVPSNTIILSLSASGVLLALLSPLVFSPLRFPREPEVITLLCLSSLPAIAAQYLMTWSFQSGEAGFVALGQYSGPVFAALLGLVAFDERLSSLQWLGAAVAIFFGVMMPLVDERALNKRFVLQSRKAVDFFKERLRNS